MKRRNILVVFVFLNSLNLFSQNESNPQLKLLIDSLYAVDQQVQLDAVAAYQRTGLIDSFIVFEKIEHATFARHNPLLKHIFKTQGYPTSDKVGKQSSSAFFTLIQHADSDIAFQQQMLPVIRQLVEKNEIPGREYVYLYDRIQINNGKEQLYGTQLDYTNEGNAVPKRLKDPQSVNLRRKQYSLEPLEEYLAKMTELHRQMNQKKQ